MLEFLLLRRPCVRKGVNEGHGEELRNGDWGGEMVPDGLSVRACLVQMRKAKHEAKVAVAYKPNIVPH